MKKYSQILTSAATASFLVLTTLAQDTPNQTTQTRDLKDASRGQSRGQLTTTGRTGRLGSAEKASKVIGMAVKNTQNEKLGKVDDLAVDLQSGRIVQVVLSIGGFVGIGDTLVAVPPGALHYDAANKLIHLDADKEKLKAAPRFEASQWEEQSQPNQVSQVYSYYGQQPYFTVTADKGQTLNPDRTKELNQTANSESRLGYVQKASKLIGMTVKNLQDEKLGKVDNFIVDLPAGRIVTVILSSGGFLGIGDELSAVPPSALRFNSERDTVLLDTTKDALANAPHFKSSQWPDMADSGYAEGVYRAYNVQPYFSAGYESDVKNPTVDNTAINNTTVNNTAVNNSARNVRDRNDQTLTPGDQGNSPADIATTRQIRKEIIAAKDMSVSARNVKIITANGRVTLRGPVKTDDEKRLIGEIAARVAQPENVDNQLEVKLTPTGAN